MKRFIYSFLFIVSLIMLPIALTGCSNNNGPVLTKLEVRVPATQTTGYKAFDEFNDEGLILKATYSNGNVVDILSGWTISYVSVSGLEQAYHTDCFYAGESKVKIDYEGQSCIYSVGEVETIDQDYSIELSEYSQIYSGNIVDLPTKNITIKNSQGEIVSDADYELVYCSSYESLVVNHKTTSNDGAVVQGGAPAFVGTYKVYAQIAGDQNYNAVYSNAVELNIVDESQIELYAGEGEEFFAFREMSDDGSSILDPAYIQFKIELINNIKTIKYNSTFAGNGIAMIFSDHISLINSDEKTQINFSNDEILVNNNEKALKKWYAPSYLGTYKMTLSQDKASEFGISLPEDETLSIRIYLDEEKNDGKVYFEVYMIQVKTMDLYYEYNKIGIVEYSTMNGSNLTFEIIDGGRVEYLFKIENIDASKQLEKFTITELLDGLEISNGEYVLDSAQ